MEQRCQKAVSLQGACTVPYVCTYKYIHTYHTSSGQTYILTRLGKLHGKGSHDGHELVKPVKPVKHLHGGLKSVNSLGLVAGGGSWWRGPVSDPSFFSPPHPPPQHSKQVGPASQSGKSAQQGKSASPHVSPAIH